MAIKGEDSGERLISSFAGFAERRPSTCPVLPPDERDSRSNGPSSTPPPTTENEEEGGTNVYSLVSYVCKSPHTISSWHTTQIRRSPPETRNPYLPFPVQPPWKLENVYKAP